MDRSSASGESEVVPDEIGLSNDPAWNGRPLVREERVANAERSDVEFCALEEDLESLVEKHTHDLALVNPLHRADAINLLHYLALRRHDERDLQRRLTDLGLSSLGRCEPHVMASIVSTHEVLSGRDIELPEGALSFEAGRAALDANTNQLFGPRPQGRVPRIMVTLDTQCASDYELVRRLVESGMDIARINGAHDGPEQWEAMITNVQRAGAETGRRCSVMMDLAGPKLRTGSIATGPRVLRLRPRRDVRGRPVSPATAEFAPERSSDRPLAEATSTTPSIPVSLAWLERRRAGDEISLTDTRGALRYARVVDGSLFDRRVRAEFWDTTYLETGGALYCGGDATTIGPLPPVEQYHLLEVGDALVVVDAEGPCQPWHHGQPGVAEITCSLKSAFSSVRVGERVLFDDGKIAGVIESVEPDRFLARITEAPAKGAKLRSEKGINLPDTDLHEPLIGAADQPLLDFAASRADMLSLSFLRRGDDVDCARAELARLGAPDLGLVLKIETQAGFANLPELLLHAMRSPAVGVMIARGDLAVEVGYARLAEVQEEILWLAEAAHLPVVWATEVLDRLARAGRPSRAEVTDAAMAQRAECVMLNKGPFVERAVVELDDIMRRMARHQRKTVPLLRRLQSWADF